MRAELAQRFEIRETHISLVAMSATEVWKIKKPVEWGFLDFSTPELRQRACNAEVELNRRLAPDVYRDVVRVVRRGGAIAFGGGGTFVDWAVHMRRLPDDQRADLLLAANRLDADAVIAIAQRLAGFHDAARCDAQTAQWGTPEAVGISIRENFEQTRDSISAYLQPAQAREIEERQLNFLESRPDCFHRRVEQHRVRDGHGDLRLEHIYISDDAIRIVDCIEFSDRLRFGDVCVDLAFLAMDLCWHGRVDLAELLVAAYAEAANDFNLYPMLDFYESYRAFVRGKISSLLAADPQQSSSVRERSRADAHRYFLLALAAERRPLLEPRVIAVGGWIASGKTTVAAALGRRLQAPVISADPTRKYLLDISPTVPVNDDAFSGAYSSAATDRVYTEIMRRAEAVLESRRTVILDASFRTRGHREDAKELARRLSVPFTFLECRADEAVLRQRLAARRHNRGISDGRAEIFDDFVSRWEPVDEQATSEHLVVDTAAPVEEILDRVAHETGLATHHSLAR